MLFFTFSIGEAQINKLHFVLVQHRQYVFSGHTLTLWIGHGRRGNEICNYFGRVAVKR